MEFFKKKSLLAIAALLAVCALFFACGSDDNGGGGEEGQFTVTYNVVTYVECDGTEAEGVCEADADGIGWKEVLVETFAKKTNGELTLAEYSGVSEWYYFDAEGNQQPAGAPGATFTVTGDMTLIGEQVSGFASNLLANDPSVGAEWIGNADYPENEWKDNGTGGWQSGGWVAHGEYVEFTAKHIATNELSWTIVVDKDDEKTDYWPWGDMAVFFDAGALASDAEIRLTYESDKAIKLVLSDVTKVTNKDGEEVSVGDEGVAYSADLPKTTGPQEIVLQIGSSKFKQPSWAKEDGLDYVFNADNIEGFAFSNGDTYGTTINVKITRLEVVGLYYEGWDQ